MKRAALILAALAATVTATAATVRTATENFVTNRIAAAASATLQSAKDYADAAIAGAGGLTPEMVTNIVQDVAPAPGNYLAVSNAAMNAASHTDAATNALLTALTRPFSEGGAIEVGAAGHATEATSAYVADTLLDKHAINRTGPDILDQLDAAAATNAAQSAALASQASQLSQQSQSIAVIGPAATNYTDSAIADADTSYRRVSFLTNLNQSVQYVSVSAAAPTTLTIDLPAGANTADWIVYVTSVTNVTLSLPSATWYMADEAYTNDIPPATPTALYFTQMADGLYMLGRQELKPITIVR